MATQPFGQETYQNYGAHTHGTSYGKLPPNAAPYVSQQQYATNYPNAQPVYPPQQVVQPVFVVTPRDDSSNDCVAIVIFLVGFCCCPVWLAGALFLRSPSGTARGFGALSIFCALVTLAVTIAVVVTLVNSVQNECNIGNPSDCIADTLCGWCWSGEQCYPYSSACHDISTTIAGLCSQAGSRGKCEESPYSQYCYSCPTGCSDLPCE
eukprot:NODE_3958_length_832_cov_48.480851_g3935_i0.p1 GENE.NODE_3958_length_832_cov_48.480851_g3935_i0~~NODE_3958_length_832_cov_48.480851_g3935_i0.p1  ORF type:complete len:233 (+),score=20.15 NODE_3958_length_832_cov_48.480851_g3935_i0:77-700(+)